MVKGTLNVSAAIDYVALSSVNCHHFEQWSWYLITVCQSTKNHLVRLSSAIILFVKHVFVIGMKSITFDSYTEFLKWKELEEEATYTTYVQKQTSYAAKIEQW